MSVKSAIGIIIILLLVAVPILFGILGDWFWFLSIGYEEVFLRVLFTSVYLGLGFGLAFLVFSLLNIRIAKWVSLRRHRKRGGEEEEKEKKEKKGEEKEKKEVKKKGPSGGKVLTGLALFFSLIVGLTFARWDTVLMYLNTSPFTASDAVFSQNIGFYFFTYPFYLMIMGFFTMTLVLTIILTFVSYAINLNSIKKKDVEFVEEITTQSYSLEMKDIKKRSVPHLSVLFAMLFFVIAFGFSLAQYSLLFSETGVVFGPGYTDLNITLPLFVILFFISIIIGILFLANIKMNRWRFILEGIMAFILILVIGFIITGVVQAFVVNPNEFNLEKPYIDRNIDSTLKAYDLNNIKEGVFPITYNLTKEDIENNAETISNIRLWDWRPLRETYNQIQLFRTYYNFNDVDIDRYYIDGKYKQVMISAREINTEELASQAKTWVNEHLVYTHGYGVVMSPVEESSDEGLPEFHISDIPPQSEYFDIKNPRIYFGEKSPEYSIIKTTTNELDYPSGDQNMYNTYDGSSGIDMSDLLKRIVYAIKFGSIELLFSSSIKPESKLLMNRDIQTRIQTIAPFLEYDPDPYIVISEGRLFWIIDAYTTSPYYPYSEPISTGFFESINYIRNSVKVVVDAYNGDVTYYVIDPDDPVIQTYTKIFPGLFTDFSEMPQSLQEHVRYPEGLFNIQRMIYSEYHMKNSQVFYNKEDVWEVPDEIYKQNMQKMVPYYVIMKLPGEEREEFIMMLPLKPRGKENLIAWMAAKSDPPNYGELVVFQFSKQELIYGPMQIEARIDQDTDISQLFTLWSQAGSAVIRGNTLVIPIEDSILYIEPVYLEATERGTLPQLKRVIVAYGNQLTMQETLEESLAVIFGEVIEEKEDGPETSEEVIAEIASLYEKAQEALTGGDLSLYAEYIEQIGDILKGY
jgi:uncharacterized membrane protein (UPF0182 family)